ncbi:acyltransferase [Streptomyces sp. NPDC048202]|uniref:acyltransferase n=1 Tax=unclassified Streptomyces TaxID=2593676 RepID=UPI00371C27E1
MRKEMEKYRQRAGRRARVAHALARPFEAAVSWCWSVRYACMGLGSPAWHRRQAALARKAPIDPYTTRRSAFYRATMGSFGRSCRVYSGVFLHYPWNISVGDRCVINSGVHITAPVQVAVGSSVLIGPYVVINSGSHEYRDRNRPIRGQGHKLGPITIEDDAWIAAHAVLLPGVTIGRGAVVAAGAVVTRSVEPFSIVGGVPAAPIGSR